MNDPLDTRIRQLVQELHDAAPAAPDWDHLDGVTIPDRPHRRSRVASWGAIAAGVVLVVAVAAVIAVRTDRHARPGPDTSAPPAVPTSATVTATSVSPVETTLPSATTSAPESTSTSSTVAEPSITWADVDAQRKTALAGYASVAFTATVTETYDGRPEMDAQHTVDVTLLNDGSMWATGDTYVFNSYDPATGTARVAFEQPDGTTGYQEVVGLTDNSMPLMVMLGSLDPTAPAGGDGATVTADGWRIEQTFGEMAPGEQQRSPQTTVWTIDRATGLVVGYEQEWSYDDQDDRARRTVTLSDIRTGVELPAEFPGSFPDGATVDRSGDPNGSRQLTMAQVAEAFGDGFVAPAAMPADAQVTITESVTQFPAADGSPDLPTVPSQTVTMRSRTGFVSTVMYLMKRSVPDWGVPDGYAAVGDAICDSRDGVTCKESVGNVTLGAGAWAGSPATAEGSAISAMRQGIQLTIAASSPDEALQLAESLVTPT